MDSAASLLLGLPSPPSPSSFLPPLHPPPSSTPPLYSSLSASSSLIMNRSIGGMATSISLLVNRSIGAMAVVSPRISDSSLLPLRIIAVVSSPRWNAFVKAAFKSGMEIINRSIELPPFAVYSRFPAVHTIRLAATVPRNLTVRSKLEIPKVDRSHG